MFQHSGHSALPVAFAALSNRARTPAMPPGETQARWRFVLFRLRDFHYACNVGP
jgi:hypothetical protein